MNSYKLTESERVAIEMAHDRQKVKRFADRLKALLFLNEGFTCSRTATLLRLHEDTIRGFYKTFKEKGIGPLLRNDIEGRAAKLNHSQFEELDIHLQEYTYTTCQQIVELIEGWWGITYSQAGVRCLLERLGYTYKKPVLTPGKISEEKQEIFVAWYKQTKENLAPEDQILFVDGVHPQYNTMPDYGWIKKGQTKQIKTNNGRQRVNINGALNLRTQEVTYVESESINSQSTIELLEEIIELYPEGKLYIILDNARYYHSEVIKAYLKKEPRLIIKALPAYSPNLNPIERLWYIMKKNRLYNKYYPKFGLFKEAINDFFEQKVWQRKEFANYLNDNFHIIKPDFSGSFV